LIEERLRSFARIRRSFGQRLLAEPVETRHE